MAILNNSNAISSGVAVYDINNSLRFRSSASAYLSRTPSAVTNRQTMTFSAWVKRGKLADTQQLFAARTVGANPYCIFYFENNDTLCLNCNDGTTQLITLNSTQVFRDPSAWYHITLAIDTTQATAANRVKVYVNGNQVTAFSTATYPSQNATLNYNTTATHFIGKQENTQYFDGYMTEVNFIDGQALTPSSFGETDTDTGSWKPKAYTGTYGTNGFYLKFSDIATTSGSNAGLGKDFSGNGNYYNTNNISVTAGTTYDAMIDSPTLTSATVANYATLNPLDGVLTLSSANLNATYSTDGITRATIWMTSGKWYWEAIPLSFNTVQSYPRCGVSNALLATSANFGETANGWSLLITDSGSFGGKGFNNNAITGTATPFALGDIAMFAYDADSGKLWFGKNGTWLGSGDPANGTNAFFTGVTAPVSPTVGANTASIAINFGQRSLGYTPPTGFVRLNTYNLPDSTVKKGNVHMDAQLYTGNGSTLTVTNTSGLQPDVVWGKSRTRGNGNWLYDTTRGVGTSKSLIPNETTAEGGASSNINLTAFNSNGFSLGTTSSTNVPNFNGDSYVAWQWKANGGTTSSNTNGSITSTVQANTTAGFSVVTYTGTGANATVGHGLGVAPKMIFIKNRSSGSLNWGVYNATVGNTKVLLLNSSAAASAADPSFWNNTSPTSTTFSLSTWPEANNSGNSFVAYCWAEIAGFSKFASYTGNGSTDGPFIFLGFRPKYVLLKRTNSTGDWETYDTSRDLYNPEGQALFPNLSNAESSISPRIDLLSNGFKLRTSGAGINGSGDSYIVAAFAENPFKNSNAR